MSTSSGCPVCCFLTRLVVSREIGCHHSVRKTRALRNHGREGRREKDASRGKCTHCEKQNRFRGEKTWISHSWAWHAKNILELQQQYREMKKQRWSRGGCHVTTCLCQSVLGEVTGAEACLSCCRYVSVVLSIFTQNITLTEQGASSLCLPLPPFAVAHMTEAAAADYTFSCDGTAPLPLQPPFARSLFP